MGILTKVTDIATKRLPKVLSPRGHAIADYLTIGGFLIAGTLFWRQSKRASLASFICGGAELATNLITDYPGGITPMISFRTHRTIDLGLAAMAASMPEFLGFPDDREKKFFLLQAAVVTGTANMTEFETFPQLVRDVRRSA
jgi:hypothetical protein